MSRLKPTLVIVESGAKAKTIAKYLNGMRDVVETHGKFNVVASFGHILDLSKKGCGVDVKQGFQPRYAIIEGKQKLIKDLQRKVSEHGTVLLASDADREGAGIAHHLREVLKLKPGRYKRITFTEITPTALRSALANGGEIDENLVQAQQARRVLDRLVGFEISPLLWRHFKSDEAFLKLSAGRVQSAALHIIVQREREARAFETASHYTFFGAFDGLSNDAKLCDAHTGTQVTAATEQEAKGVLKCVDEDFKLKKSVTKLRKESPPPPFVTSTMQQDASTKLGIGIKACMALAQSLYEAGYITYMRTDSTHLSEDAREKIGAFVRKEFGSEYLSNGTQAKVTKGKHSQEAHECIRPTDVTVMTVKGASFGKDHDKLYKLIWQRAVASCMSPAVFNELIVTIDSPKLRARNLAFVAKHRTLTFAGYLAVYGVGANAKEEAKVNGDTFKCKSATAHQVWSTPPPRFSDASLIKMMESNGIGRPSTYATTLTKLVDKRYVVKSNIEGKSLQAVDLQWSPKHRAAERVLRAVTVGEERGKLVPTDIGINVDAFTSEHFKDITDVAFTADMEQQLDALAHGKASYQGMLSRFWKELSSNKQKYEREHQSKDKVTLKVQNDARQIESGGELYTLRTTKYGPAIQYSDGEASKYISLKAYIAAKKYTGIDNVTEEDVRFLTQLPMQVKPGFVLRYGPYGFYLQHNGQNHSIYISKHVKNVPEDFYKLSKDQIEAITAWKRGHAT